MCVCVRGHPQHLYVRMYVYACICICECLPVVCFCGCTCRSMLRMTTRPHVHVVLNLYPTNEIPLKFRSDYSDEVVTATAPYRYICSTVQHANSGIIHITNIISSYYDSDTWHNKILCSVYLYISIWRTCDIISHTKYTIYIRIYYRYNIVQVYLFYLHR